MPSLPGPRRVLRLIGRLVPAYRREEWLEEWTAEADALNRARADGVEGLPRTVAFIAGAVPHALWMRTEGWTMDGVAQDLRFAIRTLGRSPGFTLVAALTLALGIGANASIFALVNGLVLRGPSGIEAPDRLVQIARSYESAPRWDNFSWPAYELIAEEASVFSDVAGYSAGAFVIGEGAESERLLGEFVTGSYFGTLGVRPLLGRLISPRDDVRPGEHRVVVLSQELWERRFGADPGIVGTTVSVGTEPYEVVGVAPRAFAGIESVGTPPALFVPTAQHPGYGTVSPWTEWGTSWISLFGRLAEGVSYTEAEAGMAVVSTYLRDASTVNDDMTVLLAAGVGLDPDGRAEALRLSSILVVIVALVLLITCTNVANLMLARSAGRRTEVGIRLAIGAGRGRVARQLGTECAVLAAAATALALPVVLMADRIVPRLFPMALSVPIEADGRVLTFLLATGVASALLFGVAPAWIGSRRTAGALRESASTDGRRGTGLRDVLVVTQLGLSLGLVAGAALLGQSVLNASTADPGFEPRGLAVARLDLATTGRYDPASATDFLRVLHERASALPGVRSVTMSNQIPLTGGHARASARPAGGGDESRFEAEYVVVGPNYLETLDIPLVSGRALGGFGEEPERVVVVNEALAAMFWPGEDAVGKEIDRGQMWRVVGVVGDVQMRSLRSRPNPAIYYPVDHAGMMTTTLQLSGANGVAPDPQRLRTLIAELDPAIPVTGVVDMPAAIARSMEETRTIGYLVGAFAGLALMLSVVGLYGLVAYGASRRVREIGIRIALGARPPSLVRLILGRGIVLAVLGIGVGFAVSVALGGVLRGLLFGIGHTDPTTLSVAAVLMLGAAILAAWLPARRASRLDPATSLRDR